MTTREMIAALWDLNGEPSDIDPWGAAEELLPENLDGTSYGAKYYLRAISAAQIQLANWRTSRGRPIRFNEFMQQTSIKLGLDNPLVMNVSKIDNYTLRLASPPSDKPEDFDNCLVYITWTSGSDYVVQDLVTVKGIDAGLDTGGNQLIDLVFMDEINDSPYVNGVLTVDLYFNQFRISYGSGLGNGYDFRLPSLAREVLKITEMKNGTVLKRAPGKETLYNPLGTVGTPSLWYSTGNKIYLDTYIESPWWFLVDYEARPEELNSIDDPLGFPPEWHEAILLLVELRTAQRMQEYDKGTMIRAELNSTIDRLRTSQEEKYIFDQTSNFYVRKEAR